MFNQGIENKIVAYLTNDVVVGISSIDVGYTHWWEGKLAECDFGGKY